MFDIGFWELAVIMIVALLVIGPERLPGLARKAGYWLGRGRRFVQNVKADIDREIAADELRRVLKEQSESSGIHEIVEQTKDTVEQTRASLRDTKRQVEQAEAQLEQAEHEYLVRATKSEEQTPPPKQVSKTKASEPDEGAPKPPPANNEKTE